MWISAEDFGLTPEEITTIVEFLWKEEQTNIKECSGCGVQVGEKHWSGCDLAVCPSCKIQASQCECGSEEMNVWDGLYPGTRDCYEKKLICTHSSAKSKNWNPLNPSIWTFDLNERMRRIFNGTLK